MVYGESTVHGQFEKHYASLQKYLYMLYNHDLTAPI